MRFFCIEKCCISFILISYPTWLYPTASTGLLPRQQYVCASLSYGYIKSLACRGSGVSIYLRWIERVFDVHQCHQFDVTHDVWHVQIFETWFFEVVVPGSSVALNVCVCVIYSRPFPDGNPRAFLVGSPAGLGRLHITIVHFFLQYVWQGKTHTMREREIWTCLVMFCVSVCPLLPQFTGGWNR